MIEYYGLKDDHTVHVKCIKGNLFYFRLFDQSETEISYTDSNSWLNTVEISSSYLRHVWIYKAFWLWWNHIKLCVGFWL